MHACPKGTPMHDPRAPPCMQMTLRVLRDENTAVKIIYLSACTLAISGVAIAVDTSAWTVPTAYQAVLLLGCGALPSSGPPGFRPEMATMRAVQVNTAEAGDPIR